MLETTVNVLCNPAGQVGLVSAKVRGTILKIGINPDGTLLVNFEYKTEPTQEDPEGLYLLSAVKEFTPLQVEELYQQIKPGLSENLNPVQALLEACYVAFKPMMATTFLITENEITNG